MKQKTLKKPHAGHNLFKTSKEKTASHNYTD